MIGKKILANIVLFSLVFLTFISIAEAKTYYGTDENGYPFTVKIEPLSKLDFYLKKLFVLFGFVNPNPVLPGHSFSATFFLTTECPSGCTPDFLVYEWQYGTAKIGVDESCYQTYMGTITSYVPDSTPEGVYTIRGWLEGVLTCRASSFDQMLFTVGSKSPDCSGKPCDPWQSCIKGIQTRVCYYEDCDTFILTQSCSQPGQTTTTLGGGGGTTTTTSGGGGDNGIEPTTILLIGGLIGLGLIGYGVIKGG